jgi:transcriptional antiterminator NusG
MKYYALQVRTNGEDKFIKQFQIQNPEIGIPLFFPQRVLNTRRKGKTTSTKVGIFPSYIFLELSSDDNVHSYIPAFKKTEGFFRFLLSNANVKPLRNSDLEIVLHFIKRVGSIAEKSKVYFDENDRIIVMEGALFGLEGKIVKVDRRKGRAKIKLDLYDDTFCIDLAFEVIEKAKN